MTQLGVYQVGPLLGSGAQAEVFLGRDKGGHEVAIKVLRMTSPEAVLRFEREVELLTELSAAVGVLPVLASGRTPDGRPYLVSPYLRGGSLRDRLERGVLAPEAALTVVTRLAGALGEAHARGIVHRDVKPENVLFEHEDAFLADAPLPEAFLADLGLAKHTGVDLERGTLSRTGQLRGTLAYMAPEQARDAKRAGPPADVYALGVVLFECLTGETPFSVGGGVAGVTGGTLAAGLLTQLNAEAPPWVERVIARCLHPSPEKRYPDARVLQRVLERRGAGVSLSLLALALLLLAALAAGGYVLAGREWHPTPTRPAIPRASTSASPAPSARATPSRPALEVARTLARAQPLEWRAVVEAAEGAIQRPGDAEGLAELSQRLVLHARARAAQGGPFPEDVDAELQAAQRLVSAHPEPAHAVALTRARWLIHRGRWKQARAALEGVPRTPEVRYLEIGVSGKNHDERRAAYVALGNEAPKSFVGRLAHAAWQSLDWRYDESTRIAAELLRERPGQEDALRLLGLGNAWKGDPEIALRAANQILDLWPDSIPATRIRAKAYTRRRAWSEQALAAYAKTIELTKPEVSARTHIQRGRYLLVDLGRSEEALADFDIAVAHRSSDGPLWRGVTRWVLGKRDDARADWKTAYAESAHWFVRRMPDLPPSLWRTMCSTVGIEVPTHLRARLRQFEARRR